jgi:hypothetical protein
VAHQERGAAHPQQHQRRNDPGRGHQPLDVGAALVDVDLERDRPVLDLLGCVPPQHVEHHRVDVAGPAATAVAVVRAGREQPAAERRGEVLDGGDVAQPVAVPAAAQPPVRRPTEVRTERSPSSRSNIQSIQRV